MVARKRLNIALYGNCLSCIFLPAVDSLSLSLSLPTSFRFNLPTSLSVYIFSVQSPKVSLCVYLFSSISQRLSLSTSFQFNLPTSLSVYIFSVQSPDVSLCLHLFSSISELQTHCCKNYGRGYKSWKRKCKTADLATHL
jgi:hypothetical protein